MNEDRAVSVVIPAWNSESTIVDAVEAALNQEGVAVSPEVIVVDDGSDDETVVRAGAAGAKIVSQQNSGPAAARNSGWREAGGDLVFFTDSDCVPATDWIARLVPHFDEPSVGAAGGSYTAANPGHWLAACIQEEIALRHRSMNGYVQFIGSFNLAIRRSILEDLGGFDETYRRASGEDNDLSYRIRRNGYRLVFDKSATVGHVHPTNVLRYMKEQFRHGYWRMRLYRDHPERITGDDYSGPIDFLEPPAALLALGLLPLLRLPLVPSLFRLSILFLAFSAVWTSIRMVRYSGKGRLLWFIPVRIARSMARGIGMAAGIWYFWILRGRR